MTIWATGGWYTRATNGLSKKRWHVALIKGRGWVHSFGTSCTTTCWNEHRGLRGWRTCRVHRWRRQNPRALLVTNRRSFQYPRIVLGEHEVDWKTSIKYLEVQLDRRLRFGKHLKIAAAKAIKCGTNLARLMQNIGGPREAKRRLVTSVVH